MNPIMIGGAVVIAVLALGNVVLWKVAGSEREARAVAEANARQWQATALECSIATEKAAKAAQEAQKRAAKALADARKGSVATQAEIARLKASSAADCKAAVAEVRMGLSK